MPSVIFRSRDTDDAELRHRTRVSAVTCVAVFEKRDRSRFCRVSAPVRSEPTVCAGVGSGGALIGCNGTAKMIAAPTAAAIRCVCDGAKKPFNANELG